MDTQTPTINAARIRELYTKGTRAIAAEQRQFWINRAYLAGEQYITWDEHSSTLRALPRDPTLERRTINRMRSASRRIMAKLLRRPLVFEVPPQDSDDATVEGARLAAAALDHLHRDHNWEQLRRDLAWHTWKGGTGLLALDWNPSAGTPLTADPDNPAAKQVGTGDTVECALSITEVATEPGCRDLERARWWIKASALPPSDVADLYGLTADPSPDASAVLSPLQKKLLTSDRADSTNNLTLVLTYYERPNAKNPAGAVATVVGDAVVEGPHPWPFPFTDRLNVVVARDIPGDGRWTGETVLTDAISPQSAINSAWTSIDEHLRKAGNARIVAEELSVDEDAFTDDPGDITWVKPGASIRPDYMTPPQMPAWWIEQPDRMAREMDDILGDHDVSRGDAPPNIGSGVGLTILAEQDDTPLGAMAKEFAEAWGRFATLVLQTHAAKTNHTRTAVIGAATERPRRLDWRGEMFRGQTTAVVPLDAVSPRSRTAQLQMAMELWRMGVVKDPKLFFRIADIPGGDDLFEGVNPDIAQQRRENHMLSLGLEVIAEEWENHALHIEELNRFRKSETYQHLDDDTKRLIALHAQQHETMAAQEMAKQVAKGLVSPALAAAAQAHEPPMAGEPAPPVPTPGPGVPPPAAGAAPEVGEPADPFSTDPL